MTDQSMGTIMLWQFSKGSMETLLSSYRRDEIDDTFKMRGCKTAFKKPFNFVIKCQTIEADGYYNPLDTPEIIPMVLLKLTLHLQDIWSRKTLQLRRKYSKEIQLIDLTNFVEDEMTLVNDPLYSGDAVSQYVERAPRHSKKAKE